MPLLVCGLDTETSGLDQSEGHRIIELATILYELESGEQKGKWVQRINPERSISPGAQAVHGITFEELVGCPTWPEVAPKLVRVLKASDLVVAHNGSTFDMPFIGMELLRIGLEIPNVPCVDTCLEARWATPLGKLPNLGELCFALGVAYNPAEAHAAAYDTQKMMECFFRGLRKGFFKLPEALLRRMTAMAA